MAITRSNRRNLREQVTVTIGGESMDVWYRPAAVTPEVIGKLEHAEQDHEAIYSVIADVVAEWDYLDDHGSRIPTTLENVRQVDIPLLSAVLNAVVEHMNPGKPTGTGSLVG